MIAATTEAGMDSRANLVRDRMTRYFIIVIGLCCGGCAASPRSGPGRITPAQLGYRSGVPSEARLAEGNPFSEVRTSAVPAEKKKSSSPELTVRGQSPERSTSNPWDGSWDGNAPMRASQPMANAPASQASGSPRVAQANALWNQPNNSGYGNNNNYYGNGGGYGAAPPAGYGSSPGYTAGSGGAPTVSPPGGGVPGYTPGYPTTNYGTAPPPANPYGAPGVNSNATGWTAGSPGTNMGGAPLPPPSATPPPPLGGSLFEPTNPFDAPAVTPPGIPADLIVDVEETTTGRFMIGAGVNSDAGVTGQVVIDEQNFDWKRFPHSVDEIIDGTAFRGDGQKFRIEAMPGTSVQRYMVNFVEPYLWDTKISLSLSGFLFDRNYFDWGERRWGGRVGLGYRLTPDLSLNVSGRAENVNIRHPRVRGVPQLEDVLGDNEIFSGKVSVAHDTRDVPFFPTQGHYLELSYEQVFGQYDFPHAALDYRKYFLLMERPDMSGRHVLANSFRYAVSGSDTPLFENFFAGGHTTMRGFSFRGASPKSGGVIVGGTLSILGSTEYIFPITADDMLRGVFFCDYGTIEERQAIHWEDFRVSLGFGLRITVPAMGPAPIALDLAVPIAREGTDDIQNFSFYMGFGR